MDFGSILASELRFDPRQDRRQSGNQSQQRRHGSRQQAAAPTTPPKPGTGSGSFEALSMQLGDVLGAAGATRSLDYSL